MKTTVIIYIPLLLALFVIVDGHQCQHDKIAPQTQKHYLNDLTDGRLLQGTQTGKLRIFVDYSQVKIGADTEINTVKRIMNISASYFYNVLNVTRLPRLYFPRNTSLTCNSLQIPATYVTNGTIGDLGIVCGNQQNSGVVYVAKSTPCAFLQSNKRPIWGMIMFNNVYLKYDQEGFQQILYVGLHQMTHILGFSASMYASYPKGNPLVSTPDGSYYLNSPKIQEEIKNFYGCNNSKGLNLEDQDGTLIASHWQKKVVGNQYMIASNKKNTFMSRFTLALLQSSGFYTFVNYSYAEPSAWGKGKGCNFLNIDNCNFPEFCNDNNFTCDADSTGIGQCKTDPFTGSCMVVKYFTNTICVDQNYELKNLNAQLNALQRGGSSSRCFQSDYRQDGTNKTLLNNRCYISVCSINGNFIYILVGSYVLVCRSEGQIINAPPGLIGTLTCPRNFARYCQNKKTCPYHCNKNGACINGQCLCTGVTQTSQSCIDVSILLAPVGTTGGLLNALNDLVGQLTNLNDLGTSSIQLQKRYIATYSINSKCLQGSAFDTLFGECLKCSDIYGCQNCNDDGCVSCDNGRPPVNNKC